MCVWKRCASARTAATLVPTEPCRRPLSLLCASQFLALSPSPCCGVDSVRQVGDLDALAKKLNPVVGYYNPTPLAEMEFWGQSESATIGFLRQAEIKHGRVAMAAFVGFVLQSNGVHFPWDMTLEGTTYAEISAVGGPAAQWDALPTLAKLQIVGFVGFLEWWSENDYVLEQSGTTHYMRGGQPGKCECPPPARSTLEPTSTSVSECLPRCAE